MKTSNVKIYLSGLAYKLGELYKVEELEENEKTLNALLKSGFKNYYKSSFSPLEFAKDSAELSLIRANKDPKDIDTLIYTTTSFWNSDFYNPILFGKFIENLGVKNAYPIGIFLSQCGNTQAAMQTAINLIESKSNTDILLVATDKSSEGARIVPPNFAVTSDSASSLILSSVEKGDYEVIYTFKSFNSSLSLIDLDKDIETYMSICLEEITKILLKVVEDIALNKQDFKQIFTNNYPFELWEKICKSTGFNIEQIYTKNLSNYGHAFSADTLINLCDFSNQNYINSNELVILLASGFNTWGVTVLRKT